MEDKIRLNFLAGVQVGSDIYFSAWNVNGLFKYNPETDQCDFLSIFPGEKEYRLHSEAILYQNTIWFIPRASERIAIFDLDSLDICYLELPECGHRTEEHIPPIRMRGYYKNGENFLFLIPFVYKLFIKIDMDKREIIKVENWGGDEYAYAVGVRYQDKLITYINCCNEMREIDVFTGTYTAKKIGDKKTIYFGIQCIDETVLLFPLNLKDGIVMFNIGDGKTEIAKLDDGMQCYYEYQTFISDNDMLLVPYEGTKVVCIHIEDDCCFVKELKDLSIQDKAYCSQTLIYNDEIWYLSHVLENDVICYTKQDGAICYRDIKISRKKYNASVLENIKLYGSTHNPLYCMNKIDEQTILLNTFLRFVINQNQKEDIVGNEQVGEYIHKLIE